MGKKRATGDAKPGGTGEPGPFNNPFGALGSLRAPPLQGATAHEQPAPAPEPIGRSAGSPYAGKLVLRRERKGHGGKTITLLQGLSLDDVELAELARELGKALGTGARVEGADIAVSGDQRERLARWLHGQGAGHVVIGN